MNDNTGINPYLVGYEDLTEFDRREIRTGVHNTHAVLALVQHMADHSIPMNHGVDVPADLDPGSRLIVRIFPFQLDAWIRSGVVFTASTSEPMRSHPVAVDADRMVPLTQQGYVTHRLDGLLPCGVRIQVVYTDREPRVRPGVVGVLRAVEEVPR